MKPSKADLGSKGLWRICQVKKVGIEVMTKCQNRKTLRSNISL